MKRTLALILSVLFVAFLFAGCGKSSAAGTYVLKSVNGKPIEQYFEDETGMDLADILELFGVESLENFMTMELKADGTATVSTIDEEPSSGTWEQKDGNIVVTIDGESLAMPLNGDELTFNPGDGDEVFVLKKK